MTFQVYIIILYFYDYKVNRSTKSVILHILKNHKKKDNQKRFCSVPHLIIDQFYLLISLEGMWSFIPSVMSVLVPLWDLHLHNM